VTIYCNFREENWRGVCETFIILLLSLLGFVKSKIGSILWRFQCVVDFYPVIMWVRQLSRDDLFDPSSGYYESSEIASFQLPKNFIAVFRSWSIVDSLYYSHFIRIGIFSDVCWNGIKSNLVPRIFLWERPWLRLVTCLIKNLTPEGVCGKYQITSTCFQWDIR
jgi:hypothetical protein